jgi:guanine deaminase
MANNLHAYRGCLLHFTGKPTADGAGVEYFDDGLLVLDGEKVYATGPAEALLAQLPEGLPVVDLAGQLIMPGFIDSHIHFPQVDVIGSYGEQLLDWLNNYTFPAEQRFANAEYSAKVADEFLNQLFGAGTTTASVYCTVHPESVDAFFTAAQSHNACMIAGKVMMDRHAPEALTDTAQSSLTESQALIDRWHNQGRQKYCVTPRFAPTSTPEQLACAGKLLADNPGVYMQTHLSENTAECEWVSELFPERKHYVDVYDHYGLLGERSIFGHGIHLSDDEWLRLADTGSQIAFCPTSNLFLGSGLYDYQKAQDKGVITSIATDVGGGTSICQLQTLNEAYKVTQMRGYSLHAYEAFYWLTLGNAQYLQLDKDIGNFEPGKTADFIVLDPTQQPLLAYRWQAELSLAEKLFLLMTLGDDRLVRQTYIAGKPVVTKPAP